MLLVLSSAPSIPKVYAVNMWMSKSVYGLGETIVVYWDFRASCVAVGFDGEIKLTFTGPYTATANIKGCASVNRGSYVAGVTDAGDIRNWVVYGVFIQYIELGYPSYYYAQTSFRVVGQPVTVRVSATPRIGPAPLRVEFYSTISGGSPPFSYRWDFGDGSSSGDQNPTHTYNNPGKYSASLTVRDSSGRSASDSTTITVSRPQTQYTISWTNVYDVDDIVEYLNLLNPVWKQSTNVDVRVDIRASDLRDVELRVSNGVVQFKQRFGNEFRMKVLSQRVLSSETLRDLLIFTFCKFADALTLKIAGFLCKLKDTIGDALEALGRERVVAEEFVIFYVDGSSERFPLNEILPNIHDAIIKKPQAWANSALIKLAALFLGSPADLLYTDSQGRRVGALYENGKYSKDVVEIQGAYYSGHGSKPQIALVPRDPRGMFHLIGTADGEYSVAFLIRSQSDYVSFERQGTIKAGEVLGYDSVGNVTRENQTPDWVYLIASALVTSFIVIASSEILLRRRRKGRLRYHTDSLSLEESCAAIRGDEVRTNAMEFHLTAPRGYV